MSRREPAWVARLLCLGIGALQVGCVPAAGGWDHAALKERYPQLGQARHRLRDLAPHPIAHEGALLLFLCRWETDQPIPVVFPGDATPDERAMLRAVLDAWSGSGLGVQFREVERATEGIHVRFVQQGDAGPLPSGAGDTIADCRVDAPASVGGRVVAALGFASVHLRRDQLDWVGLPWPLDEDARYGAALHEFGHALGFSTHVASGDSVMRPSPEIARRAGAALRRGEWEGDASLAALYAVPSGTLVDRLGISAEAIDLIEDFGLAAERDERVGPYTRVGDRGARIFYRDGNGRVAALRFRPWPSGGAPAEIVPEPDGGARRLLDASRRATP